jgi:hypothetical protein
MARSALIKERHDAFASALITRSRAAFVDDSIRA